MSSSKNIGQQKVPSERTIQNVNFVPVRASPLWHAVHMPRHITRDIAAAMLNELQSPFDTHNKLGIASILFVLSISATSRIARQYFHLR